MSNPITQADDLNSEPCESTVGRVLQCPPEGVFIRIEREGTQFRVEGTPQHHEGHYLSDRYHDRPQGLYIDWNWDGHSLKAETDPLGFYPLYFAHAGNHIVLGTDPWTVGRIGPGLRPDALALGAFFALGFFLGERTPFMNVQMLPPAGRLSWDGELTIEGGAWSSAPSSMSRESAVDAFIQLTAQAVDRRVPRDRDWGMPLSGGRDSRYLLLELLRRGEKPSFVITTRQYPPRPNVDVDTAAELAEFLDLPHKVVDPSPRCSAEIVKNYCTHFAADEHAWFVSVAKALRKYVSVSYDGIGGDTLSGHWLRMPWRKSYEAGKLDTTVEAILGRHNHTQDRSGMVPVAKPDEVAQYLWQELGKYSDHHNPTTQFMFWNRTRREIGTMAVGLMRGITTFCPYLDTDVYEMLSGLMPSVMEVNVIHDLAFERRFPECKAVGFAPYGRTRRSGMHYARFVLDVSRYIATGSNGSISQAVSYLGQLVRAVCMGGGRRRLYPLSPSRVLYRHQLGRMLCQE